MSLTPFPARLVALLLTGLLSCLGCRCAQAQSCSTSTSNGNLGTTSSFSLQSTPSRAQVGGGLSCAGLATLLATSYIRATLTAQTSLTGTGGAAGFSVPFTVYTDSGYTSAMSIGQFANLNNAPFLGLGSSSASIPLYLGTNLGANVPAGTYNGSVTINWQYAVCVTGVGPACVWARSPGLTQTCILGLACSAPTDWGSGSPTQIMVTLVVTKSCLIDNAPNVDFGTQAFVANFSAVTQNVTVHCTITEGYTLAFDMGDHPAAPWRQLQSGSNVIRYNIYYPGTTTVWNTANPQALTGLGGAPVAGQAIGYQAVIDPGQTSPPAGTYTDNVRVIVSY